MSFPVRRNEEYSKQIPPRFHCRELSQRRTRSATLISVERNPAARPGRASRVDDAIQRARARRARSHGYVPIVIPFPSYGTSTWIRILGRVALVKPGFPERWKARRLRLHRGEREPRVRGWRSFMMTVAVNDVPVTATVNGVDHILIPDRGGVIDAVVPAGLTPGLHHIALRAGTNTETTHASVFVSGQEADFGIISDIDDTVMVTMLPRPLLAAWNTFVLDEHARVPTPGMAVLYERVLAEHRGSPVVYLSTGAWNVAPALRRFLSRNLFPAGTLLLTDWGPTHDSIFRDGREHKEQGLERLASEFPGVRWLLVGDDGQHDEEIYGAFAASHPDQVAAVAIRQLSPSEAVLAGSRAKGRRRTATSGVPWVYGPDGARLFDELARVGIVTARKPWPGGSGTIRVDRRTTTNASTCTDGSDNADSADTTPVDASGGQLGDNNPTGTAGTDHIGPGGAVFENTGHADPDQANQSHGSPRRHE